MFAVYFTCRSISFERFMFFFLPHKISSATRILDMFYYWNCLSFFYLNKKYFLTKRYNFINSYERSFADRAILIRCIFVIEMYSSSLVGQSIKTNIIIYAYSMEEKRNKLVCYLIILLCLNMVDGCVFLELPCKYN